MSKELIVNVNGREKKIAIIENGRVTEFYIERGEGSQGIVGNIYKGRVMRVLPGMQSAFVDIGLERDAFLYVSDFFDEEEEFERIVIDKSKDEGASAAAARAAERIEQARLARERQIETAQERAEPFLEADEPATAAITASELSAAQPAAQESAGVAQPEEDEERDGGRRGRRRRHDKRAAHPPQEAKTTTRGAYVSPTLSQERAPSVVSEDVSTPFAAGAASFERVVDEDETAADEGELFKDAIMQERLLDQIHAVEFDMEDTPAAEVGSVLSAETSPSSSFQRVDDSDMGFEETRRIVGNVLETVAASVASIADTVAGAITGETSSAQPFERVSDDVITPEVQPSPQDTAPDTAAPPAKRSRGRRGATKGVDASTTEGITTPMKAADEKATESAEEKPSPKKRASRTRAAAGTASKAKKTTAEQKTTATKGRSRRTRQTASSDAVAADSTSETDRALSNSTDSVVATANAEDHETSNTEAQSLADAEASISARPARGEFARRGGRRRRRPVKPSAEGAGEEDRSNDNGSEAEAVMEPQEAVADDEARERPAPPKRSSRGDDGRASRGDDGRGGRERRERSTPTITDLLREGQEILVQIAKEPIAQKGARITSHIALPGRFLVYMPTIEHVGVSRKIESEGERARLRKLIQAIRTQEDVPSGGFIVRTAGVGISEEDLRDDARYLVRTWRDIRRGAEKQRAPALAHRDLDLIQRILRDQLSDDFTAIRVDSEEEYQRIVEFINRIQPRLVKRVKLYTREEPILEAYGVQAEIDKAIKPRVWLRSGGYLVINQTEALVAIDVNTGKFVGRGGSRLEDTITRTNMEAVEEIARQIRLRDLGGIIVLDLIDMEERRNRQRVMQALQESLKDDKSPTKVLSFNDFGLVIMTRKRVKQSLERTLCSPCPYCQGSSLVKSPQTVCYEILEEARRLARSLDGEQIKQATLRINPEVARALRSSERDVLNEIEDYLGAIDITSDEHVHQEQFDFAFI